MATLNLYISLM